MSGCFAAVVGHNIIRSTFVSNRFRNVSIQIGNIVAALSISFGLLGFWFLIKHLSSDNAPKKTKVMISDSEKEKRIKDSITGLLCSPNLDDVCHAEMLIEGLCSDDPNWLGKVLGNYEDSDKSPIQNAPHKKQILRWAASLDHKK